ncbi:MAG: FapA family protein [Geovibrio sp.]|nr:FapA family protein [Geovibrio sp.]
MDYSTGNIVFNGVVHIRGDVLSGFSVKAEKDIMVEGIVQDATMVAGGSIVIKTGIKGEVNNNVDCRR